MKGWRVLLSPAADQGIDDDRHCDGAQDPEPWPQGPFGATPQGRQRSHGGKRQAARGVGGSKLRRVGNFKFESNWKIRWLEKMWQENLRKWLEFIETSWTCSSCSRQSGSGFYDWTKTLVNIGARNWAALLLSLSNLSLIAFAMRAMERALKAALFSSWC